jgi:hypothetical protein
VEGSDRAAAAGWFDTTGIASPGGLIAAACAIATVAILAAKFLLSGRLNVNWDEFLFLSHVYALERGELDLFLQGAYAHAFSWVPSTAGDEIDQVVRLRILMCLLLAASAGLAYRLARLWATRAAAVIATFAFLSTWPVLKHGASFRADSLLLPLTVAVFYFTLRSMRGARRSAVIAGIAAGLALVVTLKAALLLPALILMSVLPGVPGPAARAPPIAGSARLLALIFAVATLVAAALLAAHAAHIAPTAEAGGTYSLRVLRATLFDVPIAPRRDTFIALVSEDWMYWLALAAGLIVAVRQRSFSAAASLAALAPVLFYRNAFPYYYPVMLAPTVALIALAADWLLGRKSAGALLALAASVLILVGSAWDSLMTLRYSSQARQRSVVAAVHRVFPQPVPYLDHGAMIASFPKVNFFMSTWGVEAYLSRGSDFMPGALAKRCPPLLLVDYAVLSPGSLLNRQLRETDRRLLDSSYVEYWGPIRVAGTKVEAGKDGSASFRVPCTGDYRVESKAPIRFEGAWHGAGSTIGLTAGRDYRIGLSVRDAAPASARLVWAEARKPPAETPPELPLYDAL